MNWYKRSQFDLPQGFEVIDRFETEDYQIGLIMGPLLNVPQVAIQRVGLECVDIGSQMCKHQLKTSPYLLVQLKEVMSKILEWKRDWGQLVIGSHNKRYVELYKSIFKKYGFEIKPAVHKNLSDNYFII